MMSDLYYESDDESSPQPIDSLTFGAIAAEKRKKILDEFLDTEKIYVKGLGQLKEFYIEQLKMLTQEGRDEKARKMTDPITNDNSPNELVDYFVAPIVSYAFIKECFGTLQVIAGINNSFLAELENKVYNVETNPDDNKFAKERKLADLLLFFGQTFQLYSPFIAHYNDIAAKIAAEKKENEAFAEFLREKSKLVQQANNGAKTAHSIENLIITPVQRIYRYKMLLDDLVRKMEEQADEQDQEDMTKIKRADELITKIAVFCNEKTGERENSKRLVELQAELHMYDLFIAHRKLLKESNRKGKITYTPPGYSSGEPSRGLFNMFASRSEVTVLCIPCVLFLFNDMLVISKKPETKSMFASFSSVGDYSPVILRVESEDGEFKYEQHLQIKTSFRIYQKDEFLGTVNCSDKKEYAEWMKMLT
jgi:hypothetical protein